MRLTEQNKADLRSLSHLTATAAARELGLPRTTVREFREREARPVRNDSVPDTSARAAIERAAALVG